jgi:hypothetical protein
MLESYFIKRADDRIKCFLFVLLLGELDWYIRKRFWWSITKAKYANFVGRITFAKKEKLPSGFLYKCLLFMYSAVMTSSFFANFVMYGSVFNFTYEDVNVHLVSFILTICTVQSGSVTEFLYLLIKNYFVFYEKIAFMAYFEEDKLVYMFIFDIFFVVQKFIHIMYKHDCINGELELDIPDERSIGVKVNDLVLYAWEFSTNLFLGVLKCILAVVMFVTITFCGYHTISTMFGHVFTLYLFCLSLFGVKVMVILFCITSPYLIYRGVLYIYEFLCEGYELCKSVLNM